jgi:hypothetical protein
MQEQFCLSARQDGKRAIDGISTCLFHIASKKWLGQDSAFKHFASKHISVFFVCEIRKWLPAKIGNLKPPVDRNV